MVSLESLESKGAQKSKLLAEDSTHGSPNAEDQHGQADSKEAGRVTWEHHCSGQLGWN